MWRFFRFGIKSNSCHGNQAHFRAIGTTCANAECDDRIEESSDTICNKENITSNCKESLAAKAAKDHQNFLQYNSSKQHFKEIPFNVKTDKLKAVDDKLSWLQWQQYLRQRKKLLASDDNKKDKTRKSENTQKVSNKNGNSVEESETPEEEEKFGSLSKVSRTFEYMPEDEEDIDHPLKDTFGKKLSAQLYGRKMLELCQKRKLKEALDVLELEMKVQNVTPNEYCYNVLINACGKAGYQDKAFQLYDQMKRRGLRVQKFAYTGLFNACANSPFKEKSLEASRKLRKELQNKEKSLSPISYHAMIKAFGHCGDIETAFEVADEMLDVGHVVTTETMNFLLQACVSDKENGFRHALMVWRRMRALKIKPCIYSYNLLLRCVKECHAGDSKLVSNLLEGLHPSHHQRLSKTRKEEEQKKAEALREIEERVFENDFSGGNSAARDQRSAPSPIEDVKSSEVRRTVHQIPEGDEVVTVNLAENMELEIVAAKLPSSAEESKDGDDVLPDLLASKFRSGKVASITSLETSVDRLWLLRGIPGIMENMLKDRVKPTMMTFTLLLDSLPPTLEAEQALLSAMESFKMVPDVIFFNRLIRKRAFRSLEEAKQVLELMREHHVLVDLITFGCLAIACRKPWEMDRFFTDMDRAGFIPNEEIVETLLINCTFNSEFGYIIELLKRMKKYGLTPNESIIHHLEETRDNVRERMIQLERTERPLTSYQSRLGEEMKVFLMEYKNWLKRSKVELKDHPWTQFGYQDNGQQVVKVSSTS